MNTRINEEDSHLDPAANRVDRHGLTARLGERAPDPIAIGGGTAILLEGTLDGGGFPLDGLRVRLGEIERDVDGFGVESERDGAGLWWSLVPIPASTAGGTRPLALLARGGGEEVVLGLGEIELVAKPALPAIQESNEPGPLIAICMATHEPAEAQLRLQLESIRAQRWQNWVCLISDDTSSPEAFARLEGAVGGDARFRVSRSEQRLGFLRNFERAIAMIPPQAELIALADQDDRWYPAKLEELAATLARNPRAALAYSDMRIVDGEGRVLSDTYWYLRRNRYDDIASLLVTNVVTGAASLLRRELLADALPFPPAAPGHAVYHDHWLALCALAGGEIAYLDHPTYDYFRHDDSVTVREDPRWLRPQSGFAGRLRLHWARMTRRIRMGSSSPSFEAIYRERWLLIQQLAAILELRLGDRIAPAKRRSLRRLAGAESSPLGVAWLVLRCLRPLIGRNETLARERVLLGGLTWRWRGQLR